MTAVGCGVGLGGGGVQQNGKKAHGHGQKCGDFWGEGFKGTKW